CKRVKLSGNSMPSYVICLIKHLPFKETIPMLNWLKRFFVHYLTDLALRPLPLKKSKTLIQCVLMNRLDRFEPFEINLDEAKRSKSKETNIALQVVKTVPIETGTTIEDLQEQIALITNNFNEAFKSKWS
ncbi:hypothetical protein J1N35_004481, partial [Gossypium stocksii]